ncbi:hypothetical protein [Lewinella cohaerens]|uniref:hypothetical protein n=1 Tax=Lewinella cohaerens TaxID=70995 RepID=UPI00035FC32A|nr:hypothetical protein [Lewinella cohaerens]
MMKFFFSTVVILLTFNLMTSCGNTEGVAEGTTEAVMEEQQEAASEAETTLKEKTKSIEVSTYKTPAAMKEAVESLSTDIQSKITKLEADLNNSNEEVAAMAEKKIGALREYEQLLQEYEGKFDKINETDAPDFGKNVATLVNKIRRDIATFDDKK